MLTPFKPTMHLILYHVSLRPVPLLTPQQEACFTWVQRLTLYLQESGTGKTLHSIREHDRSIGVNTLAVTPLNPYV